MSEVHASLFLLFSVLAIFPPTYVVSCVPKTSTQLSATLVCSITLQNREGAIYIYICVCVSIVSSPPITHIHTHMPDSAATVCSIQEI